MTANASPPQTPDHIRRAQAADQPRSHFAQHGVSGVVAVGIVDGLEVVDVQRLHQQRPAVAATARNPITIPYIRS